ncbi:hypothetical protein PVAND_006454 [Polypedilum vanderplanki]|uniref:Uncharacterized protein n=1 Tax=Polypedilum vanderplanki TaxID=319348 RepID=A0A9J6C3P5_POLVA|nr:hypothetical protein PVAND_006454 [Polypedilum vanderplanki]
MNSFWIVLLIGTISLNIEVKGDDAAKTSSSDSELDQFKRMGDSFNGMTPSPTQIQQMQQMGQQFQQKFGQLPQGLQNGQFPQGLQNGQLPQFPQGLQSEQFPQFGPPTQKPNGQQQQQQGPAIPAITTPSSGTTKSKKIKQKPTPP